MTFVVLLHLWVHIWVVFSTSNKYKSTVYELTHFIVVCAVSKHKAIFINAYYLFKTID